MSDRLDALSAPGQHLAAGLGCLRPEEQASPQCWRAWRPSRWLGGWRPDGDVAAASGSGVRSACLDVPVVVDRATGH